jgi:hypothetical protein
LANSDTESRRVGCSSPDGRDEQEASLDPCPGGASAPVADVVPFRRPGSYLDAARAQGVHQEHEELLDSIATLRRRTARTKAEGGSVAHLAEHSDNPVFLERELADQRQAIMGRVGAIVTAFHASALGAQWLPTLRVVLLEESLTAETATAFFAACAMQDTAQSQTSNPTAEGDLSADNLTRPRSNTR